LIPAKGRWCSVAGKVTAGLAESNVSLQPGGWLTVICGLTACIPGSALGPMLVNECGKPLPFRMKMVLWYTLTSADNTPEENCIVLFIIWTC